MVRVSGRHKLGSRTRANNYTGPSGWAKWAEKRARTDPAGVKKRPAAAQKRPAASPASVAAAAASAAKDTQTKIGFHI